MRQISITGFLLTVFFASLALPQSKTSSAKKPVRKTSAAAKNGKTSSKTGKRTAVTPYRQAAPTPERYKEIQQALAEKGYLKSEPNGVWDADSSAAMAKFQSDRNLSPTGKLSSASLIALGLGPSTAPIPPIPAASASGQTAPVLTPTN